MSTSIITQVRELITSGAYTKAGMARAAGLHANTLRDLWDEFEAGETPAARYANAIDRILPVMQNVAADGFSWRAHGVRLEQVLSRNAIVGEVLPNVWASVRPQIEAVFAAMNGLRDES